MKADRFGGKNDLSFVFKIFSPSSLLQLIFYPENVLALLFLFFKVNLIINYSSLLTVFSPGKILSRIAVGYLFADSSQLYPLSYAFLRLDE